MTKPPPRKMPLNILQKLENAISESLKDHVSLVYDLADLLCLSKESVYRRLRGSTSFTFEELWLIYKSYGISVDALFNAVNAHQYDLHFISVSDLSPSAYTRDLSALYKKLGDKEHIYLFASQIPLIHLLEYPHLSAFKFDLWNHLYNTKRAERNTEVLPDHTERPVNETYSFRHEMWSSNATNQILHELEYATALGLQFSEAFLFDFFKELLDLVEVSVFPENKNNVVLYEQELDIRINITMAFGEVNAMIVHYGDDMVGYASGGTDTSNQKAWVEGLLRQSIRITGQSERQKRNFYFKLVKPVFEKATLLLPTGLVEKLRLGRKIT